MRAIVCVCLTSGANIVSPIQNLKIQTSVINKAWELTHTIFVYDMYDLVCPLYCIMQFVISCNVWSGVGGDLLKHVKSQQFVMSYNN